jgi:hypothetical protein
MRGSAIAALHKKGLLLCRWVGRRVACLYDVMIYNEEKVLKAACHKTVPKYGSEPLIIGCSTLIPSCCQTTAERPLAPVSWLIVVQC